MASCTTLETSSKTAWELKREELTKSFRTFSRLEKLSRGERRILHAALQTLKDSQLRTPLCFKAFDQVPIIEQAIDLSHKEASFQESISETFALEAAEQALSVKRYPHKYCVLSPFLFPHECIFHASLQHPQLVRFLGRYPEEKQRTLVAERGKGHFSMTQSRKKPLSLSRRIAACLSLAGATAYLHHHAVVHGNICPKNLIRFPKGKAKLGNFAFSHLEKNVPGNIPELSRFIGDPSCTPPEMQHGAKQSRSGDIYRLASSCWQVLAGKAPARQSSLYYFEPQEIPKSYRQVIADSLNSDPDKRPKAEEFLTLLLEASMTHLETERRDG